MNRIPVPFPHHGAEDSGYAVLLMDPRSGAAIGLHHHDANPGQLFEEVPDRPGPHLVRGGRARGSRHVGGLARRAWRRALRGDRHRQPDPLSVVVFRDPDNIQLELFYMAT